jgi:hypothetical protein
MTTTKRQKRVVGDVIEIPIADGFYAYAITLSEATYGFYDLRVKKRPSLALITSCTILFRVAVMDSAVTKGRWVVVGHSKLSPEQEVLPPKFIQDPIKKDQFSIYENGKIRPASRDECFGLSRASVWSPEHVEERLNDHFAGRINKWELQDRLPPTSLIQ